MTQTEIAYLISIGVGILALLILAYAVMLYIKNRTIRRENQILAQQIAEANYKELRQKEKLEHESEQSDTDLNAMTDEQLFRHIHDVVVRERLFLDPKFERQTIIDRFQLSKDRVGSIFSKGSNHTKLTSYIQQLRLEYAAKLLMEQPDKSIVQIAAECGFSSNTYFSACFRQYYSMTPSEFRQNTQNDV
jgi:AraC-like DNA-binding protein